MGFPRNRSAFEGNYSSIFFSSRRIHVTEKIMIRTLIHSEQVPEHTNPAIMQARKHTKGQVTTEAVPPGMRMQACEMCSNHSTFEKDHNLRKKGPLFLGNFLGGDIMGFQGKDTSGAGWSDCG